MINKVIEVLAKSDQSWEDAAQSAVSEVSDTVRDVRSVFIENMSGKVVDGKIIEYRINARITFEVKH